MIDARIRKRFTAGAASSQFTLDLTLKTSAGATVLFGPSGSGKTLTLDCIAGFVRPDEGRIQLFDEIVFDAAARVNIPPRRRRCGYVFQNYALFPHMTLRQNLEFAAALNPESARSRTVPDMLERFRLTGEAERRPHQVSGGQKQRCSIARALIGQPRVLLLDEPARGLDAPLRSELYDLLRQVTSEFGTPALLVTHDLEEGLALGDSMLVMTAGRLVQSGSPAAVVADPVNLEVARLFGIYNLLPAEICALDAERNTSDVQFEGAKLTARYLPGHNIGDRITMFIRPVALRAIPSDRPPGPNQIVAELERAVERPDGLRLSFTNGVAVDLPRAEFDASARRWAIEFPADAIRVL